MFDETTAAGVMVIAGCPGAAEPFPEAPQKEAAEMMKPRVGEISDGRFDKGVVDLLLAA